MPAASIFSASVRVASTDIQTTDLMRPGCGGGEQTYLETCVYHCIRLQVLMCFRRCLKTFFQVAVNGTKIAYLGKCSFSECYGNAEIGWMTFELSDISITERKAKQLSKVEHSAVH